jgi:hypothetical protein
MGGFDQLRDGNSPPITSAGATWRSRAAKGVVASKFEHKCPVEEERAQRIKDYIRPVVFLDRFASSRDLVRDPICSLHLDSPNLELCRNTLHGHKNRYELRVRSYSDDPHGPLFLEVKRRTDGMVLKGRPPLSRAQGRPFSSAASP